MRLGYQHHDTDKFISDISSLSTIVQGICQELADNPFVTQRELSKKFSLPLDQLLVIIQEIRASESAQNYILYN